MASKRLLLVEGTADKLLFDHVIKLASLDVSVTVAPPKDIGGHYNTKGGIFNIISLLLAQMMDGGVGNFGVVVDADYVSGNGMGFEKTLRRFADLVQESGFDKRQRVGHEGGFLFCHADGLADVGLWVMPDNDADGMIEDWAEACVADWDKPVLDYANKVLKKVPGPRKYKDIHKTKALIATWLSWQKIPGQGLHQGVRDGAIDLDKVLGRRLLEWLRRVFP